MVTLEGNPWFVAIDVCKALEMDVASGSFKWLTRLDADEKQTHRLAVGTPGGVLKGNPSATIISESGLYKLVMRSDNPEAKAF